MPAPRGLARYRDFWPHYLAEHSRPGTRGLHLLGTAAALALLGLAAGTGLWWLVPAALLVGYGLAWLGHARIERNRPASFAYPLWSLVSDLRMLGLWLAGRLEGELRRRRR